jgi:nicotinamide phosphoribosyltransferase
MLTQFAKPGGLLAIVSDSYDLWYAIDHLWGDLLRQAVIDSGATVVIRPDSGNPVEIVGKVLQRLEHHFGSTINRKGYKVLNHVRVIQGDGVNETSIIEILDSIERLGFSATNLAFGMGGALLQKLNRDTQQFAVKCSEVIVENQAIAVYKDPITDPGKKSKAGRQVLLKTPTGYQTVPETPDSLAHNQLEVVYENGVIQQETSFEQVRQRAWSS